MNISLAKGASREEAMAAVALVVDDFFRARARKFVSELLAHGDDLDVDTINGILADARVREAEAREVALAEAERMIIENTSK